MADIGAVKVLTAASFNKTIKAHPAALVEFYAPCMFASCTPALLGWLTTCVSVCGAGCGHCKSLAPHFEETAKRVPDVLVAKVNCDLNLDLCKQHAVQGYPTILFFQ